MDRKIQTEQKHNLIEMNGIGRDYQSGENAIKALSDVNLNISKGEFIGIMGPSASGKSTLLNIIGCLDAPTSGNYQLLGKDIKSFTANEKALIRNTVFGFIFQAFHLLADMDIATNVALPLKYSNTPKRVWKERVREALVKVNLEEVINRYPDQLSAGQQQRVAIARALVCNPDVILADEPTGNLDSSTGQSIMELLKKLNQDEEKTVIVISHDTRIVGYVDRLIRIEDGRITEDMWIKKQVWKDSRMLNPFLIKEESEYEHIL